MEIHTLLILALTVFGSALLQAATGIGYGVIAGPVLLVVLDGTEAIQISTLHNLLIALVLFPFVYKHVNTKLLWPIIAGSFFGIAAGFYLQTLLDSDWLKVIAAGMVFFVMSSLMADLYQTPNLASKLLRLGSPKRAKEKHSTVKESVATTTSTTTSATATGLVAGVMGGMLAMPGPVVATWMAIRGFAKNQIRATVSAYFIFAYGATLVCYLLFSGLDQQAVRLSAGFAPLVLLGVFCGHRIAGHLSEMLFRKILLLVLLATLCSLLISLLL